MQTQRDNPARTRGEDSVHEAGREAPGGRSCAHTVISDSQPPELGEDKLPFNVPRLWPLVMAIPDAGALACGDLMGLMTFLRGSEARSGRLLDADSSLGFRSGRRSPVRYPASLERADPWSRRRVRDPPQRHACAERGGRAAGCTWGLGVPPGVVVHSRASPGQLRALPRVNPRKKSVGASGRGGAGLPPREPDRNPCPAPSEREPLQSPPEGSSETEASGQNVLEDFNLSNFLLYLLRLFSF